MLELTQIRKIYPVGGETIEALKGIDLKFRSNEFVSILGPSGCGKTTLLNIIGGLDRYTSGDLVINGVSTKEYKARDWDAYRNYSVGFVFQSYNLIPHQSVLQNVELALTLSGVGKSERRRRAKEALERVGLGNQMRKRPSEMSGGQMQRVAIARAIVNNPDIILADEPTGALDSETSIQVMEILKEIARDRLVVMVTHNPELAEQYSTRIVRMLDGRLLSDSAPLSPEEEAHELALHSEKESLRKKKKPSMSLSTGFGLSLKNLFSKKGRTALTSFAGSIGIIGIALIYAVSNGMTAYINMVQEETLSSYPLSIEATYIDSSSIITTFLDAATSGEAHENDAVYQKELLYDMMKALSTVEDRENDLKGFKAYIEEQLADEESTLYSALSSVQYSYAPELLVYTKNVDGDIVRSDTQKLMAGLMAKFYGSSASSSSSSSRSSSGSMFGGSMSMMSASSQLWRELLSGNDGSPVNEVTKKQYDLVYGSWPARFDEIVLFVDSANELNDLTLYALGLKPAEEIESLVRAAMNKEPVDYVPHKWSYEEICAQSYRVILNSDCYSYDEATDSYKDLRDTDTGLKYLYDNALQLHIVGIVKPNEDALGANVNGAIGYTKQLTSYVLERANESAAVMAQKETPGTDILTGLPFRFEGGEDDIALKAADFRAYVDTLTDTQKAGVYVKIMMIPETELVDQAIADALASVTREDMEATLTQAMAAQTGVTEEQMTSYFATLEDADVEDMYAQLVREQYKMQYASNAAGQLSGMAPEQLIMSFETAYPNYTDEQCAVYYDEILEFSSSTYEKNLVKLGSVDLNDPKTVNLYASSFSDKDLIEDAIAAYNETVEELQEIRYTDYVGLMMSSVTTIINAITYVLIAFVAVSLVVSSIMIGVITLISVQERTKEIGILRAVGASKRNVSNMFNAETVIIGFTSGLIGVGITYLLCIPINAVFHSVTHIDNLNAILPIPVAVILVGISVFLTLIAGIIPSRSASKKDPVVALRTE